MALRFYNNIRYGQITIRQTSVEGAKDYKLRIVAGNCLAVVNYYYTDQNTGAKMVQLYTFFEDAAHIRRILKNNGSLFSSEVKSIKLNLYYKESVTLCKLFTMAGYKVTAYYKESKQKKNKR